MSDFSITGSFDKAKTNALELYNKFRFNTQQTDGAVASNWTPQMQNNLMGALNGQGATNDSACGRLN